MYKKPHTECPLKMIDLALQLIHLLLLSLTLLPHLEIRQNVRKAPHGLSLEKK
jgi:hypothetical protein